MFQKDDEERKVSSSKGRKPEIYGEKKIKNKNGE